MEAEFLSHSRLYTAIRVESPEGRYYTTDDSNLRVPSITGVLSVQGESWIDEWKAKVGEVYAAKVSRNATVRGTAFHSACEHYLMDKNSPSLRRLQPEISVRLNRFKSFLDTIDEVWVLEGALLSKKLAIGGTVDCIGVVDGKLSVIDFKTSKRLKSREDIPSYFVQATFYALAFSEQYGIEIEDIIIAISVENERDPLIYRSTIDKHVLEFYHIIQKYRRSIS